MEATALCIRTFLPVFMLLVAKDTLSDSSFDSEAASPHIVANRLQLFEYDSITCDCVGFDEFTDWRVMRRILGVRTFCGTDLETSIGRCRIEHAYEADSGVYWCENHGGRKSSSVNITVTTGSVILKSPSVPVTEGEDLTLTCINTTTSSVPVANFYKDGSLKYIGDNGSITIRNVSNSDEGFYKCEISGVGESPLSWLAVVGREIRLSTASPEIHPSHHLPPNVLYMCIICSVAVLLVVVGLGLCWKDGGMDHTVAMICISHDPSAPRPQSPDTGRVSEVTSAAQQKRTIYSLISATRSFEEPGEFRVQLAPETDQTTTLEHNLYDAVS